MGFCREKAAVFFQKGAHLGLRPRPRLAQGRALALFCQFADAGKEKVHVQIENAHTLTSKTPGSAEAFVSHLSFRQSRLRAM